MPSASWAAFGVALIGLLVLIHLHRRHVARVQRDRSALFASCAHLLEEPRLQDRHLDFPVLHGRFQGRDVRVEPVVDTLSLRLIPVLRLVVTVRVPLAGQPRLSVLADESGQEFFAGHRDLMRLRDDRWPARIAVACDIPEVDADLVDELVDVLAGDSTVKQLLVTDRGVRCVVRGASSDGATYRVTRRVDLSGARVAPEVLLGALQRATWVGEQVGRRAAVAGVRQP